MTTHNLKQMLETLKIGESMAIESTNEKELKKKIDQIPGNFVINKVSETMFSILKIDYSIVSKSNKILLEVKNLNYFNEILMDFSPGYVRSVISAHNKKENDFIKVIKKENGVYITRSSFDVNNMTNEQISECINELQNLIKWSGDIDDEEIM